MLYQMINKYQLYTIFPKPMVIKRLKQEKIRFQNIKKGGRDTRDKLKLFNTKQYIPWDSRLFQKIQESLLDEESKYGHIIRM